MRQESEPVVMRAMAARRRASGSSQTRTKLRVPSGERDHSSGGETFVDFPGKSGGAFDSVNLSGGPYEPTSTTRRHR